MIFKLNEMTTSWDEAALETLGSEFKLMDLLLAQKITNGDGSSIIDDILFHGPLEVSVPETIESSSEYFKAPWD